MPAVEPDKVLTRTVTPGTEGTRISRAKYDAAREALLAVIPPAPGSIAFSELPAAVRARLPGGEIPGGGSVSWYVTVVKLDLEARGLIERLPGPGSQRLRRSG